jgi:hypothetical protein
VAGSGAAVMAWQVNDQPSPRTSPATRVMASLRPRGSATFRPPLQLEGLHADSLPYVSADAAPDGSAAVGVVRITSSHLYEARVYLVPRTGAKLRTLVARRDEHMGRLGVLRDARGTLAVVATHTGLRAVWKR